MVSSFSSSGFNGACFGVEFHDLSFERDRMHNEISETRSNTVIKRGFCPNKENGGLGCKVFDGDCSYPAKGTNLKFIQVRFSKENGAVRSSKSLLVMSFRTRPAF